MVAAIEDEMVSQILFCTSDSRAVSNRLMGEVEINIPTNGARMNNKMSPARKLKIRLVIFTLFTIRILVTY